MSAQQTQTNKRVNVEGLVKLPAFSHAVIAGDFIFVAGTLGVKPGERKRVPGGVGPETEQSLRNIESVLKECGAGLGDVVKVTVYLDDMTDFDEMNEAYIRVMGTDPPARATLGANGLALGAGVEIEAVAHVAKR